ncbi:MAG: Crp/Fnr family transcriptional regulator [Marinifilaceae bacterium]|jgi:CRP-like cAMP-binding protein|nr:Crp/Fnr family transcriptional regulator [Marinifilaceae bacterium]
MKKIKHYISSKQEVFADFLSHFPSLTENDQRLLFNESLIKFYDKGENLYFEDDKLFGSYYIYSGIIKIYQTGSEGKEQIIRFSNSKELIAFRSVINQELACTSAKAIVESLMLYIPSKLLIKLLKSNSEFAFQMIRIVCSELGESNGYITDIAQKSVKRRLAEILVKLTNSFGLDNEMILKLSISREELANIVGTATETVIRIMKEFKNEKIIESRGRKLLILNLDRLKEISR